MGVQDAFRELVQQVRSFDGVCILRWANAARQILDTPVLWSKGIQPARSVGAQVRNDTIDVADEGGGWGMPDVGCSC